MIPPRIAAWRALPWLLLAATTVVLGGCKAKQVRPAGAERSVASAPKAPRASTPLTVRHGPAPAHERDGGPPIPPDVSRVRDPVPRAEPRAAYGNKSPYTVLGRTYTVMPSAKGYVERGIASWYGTKFHGRLTSSREPYDMYQMTAAHKSLPLPSYVHVTNLDNGRHIIVRVNDRGPFHENRIIDLSYAAAIKLGIHIAGTGKVEVRAIDPGHPELDAAPVVVASATPRPLFLQVGAFSSRENARQVAAKLEKADIEDVYLDRVLTRGKLLHRVRVGPLKTVAEVDALTARLHRLGLRSIVVDVD